MVKDMTDYFVGEKQESVLFMLAVTRPARG